MSWSYEPYPENEDFFALAADIEHMNREQRHLMIDHHIWDETEKALRELQSVDTAFMLTRSARRRMTNELEPTKAKRDSRGFVVVQPKLKNSRKRTNNNEATVSKSKRGRSQASKKKVSLPKFAEPDQLKPTTKFNDAERRNDSLDQVIDDILTNVEDDLEDHVQTDIDLQPHMGDEHQQSEFQPSVIAEFHPQEAKETPEMTHEEMESAFDKLRRKVIRDLNIEAKLTPMYVVDCASQEILLHGIPVDVSYKPRVGDDAGFVLTLALLDYSKNPKHPEITMKGESIAEKVLWNDKELAVFPEHKDVYMMTADVRPKNNDAKMVIVPELVGTKYKFLFQAIFVSI